MRIYQLVDGDNTYHFFRTKAEAKQAKTALITIYRDLDAEEKAKKLEIQILSEEQFKKML